MEVNEAIDNIKYYINFYKDNFITENQKLAMEFNQLEYENKLNLLEYEKEKIINLLKSLEAENKKLKKDNEVYKGIVEEIENDFGNGILQNENGFGVKLEHLIEIKKQKFFGGRK